MSLFAMILRGAFMAQPGQPRTSNGILGTLAGLFAGSPCTMVTGHTNLGLPKVEVEAGWGTGDIEPIHADQNNLLYTGPHGTGYPISDFASGRPLFPTKIYNQYATDLSSYASPISADLRVLLNYSVAGAPFFAGYGVGSQDVHQHATQRGYLLPINFSLADYFTLSALYQAISNETCALVQDTVDGATRYWQFDDAGAKRNFLSWAITVGSTNPNTLPQYVAQWATNLAQFRKPQSVAMSSQVWGMSQENGAYNISGTTSALRLFGPVNPLKGRCYGIDITNVDRNRNAMEWNGEITKRWCGISSKVLIADQLIIAFPVANAVISMKDVVNKIGDMPIKLVARPGVAYEAKLNSGPIFAIGTAPANGRLDTALANVPMDIYTLYVREVGGSTWHTVANVAIGYTLVVWGESNGDGRGDIVPMLTIPTNYLRRGGLNWELSSTYKAGAAPSTIASGGSGYSVGRVLTLVGGTFGTASQFTVLAVDGGGAVTSISDPLVEGEYTVLPSNPITTTVDSGPGTGCTITGVFGIGKEFWLPYCQKIYDTLGCVINVIKVTLGSTYIVPLAGHGNEANWNPPSEGIETVYKYGALVLKMRIGQCEFNKPNKILADIGINDMSLGATKTAYKAIYVSILAALQSDINSDITMTHVVSGQGFGISDANVDAIRLAQVELAATTGNRLAGSFAHKACETADGTHWKTFATKDNLSDILKRYEQHEWLGGAQQRAPIYASAVKTGDHVVLTFTSAYGPFTHSGGDSEVLGWTCSDGSGSLTVLSAIPSVSGSDVRLNFNRTIVGTLSVQFNKNTTAIGTTLADAHSIPLPPEPFGPVAI